MKRLVPGLPVLLLVLAIALSPLPAAQVCEIRANPAEAGTVLCCCQTPTGSCCGYVIFCGPIIPGCLCTGG